MKFKTLYRNLLLFLGLLTAVVCTLWTVYYSNNTAGSISIHTPATEFITNRLSSLVQVFLGISMDMK